MRLVAARNRAGPTPRACAAIGLSSRHTQAGIGERNKLELERLAAALSTPCPSGVISETLTTTVL